MTAEKWAEEEKLNESEYDNEVHTVLNYVPDIVLNGSHIITNLILMEILWDKYCCYHLIFTNKETETQKI